MNIRDSASKNKFDLTGTVAIVTGGNGGIGLGMARALAGAGAALMIVGRDQAKNTDAVKELNTLGAKAVSVGADLADEAACRSVVEETVAGLVQLTKALATAWAAENIQVNAILPGWIDTDLTRTARAHVDGLNEQVLARTPAGRWGVPEDLAGGAVFLASPASDFVTGTAIPVDGGFAAQG
jgi:NAD(P)-dependent dehydrogenase (short-subunit alcohol dehydrogenase family)